MTEDAVLAEVAAGHGIDRGYWDIWGRYHETRAATERALLAAMGIDVATPAALEQARARIAGGEDLLAPVIVVREGAPVRVELTLPAGVEAARLGATLIEERGRSERLEAELHELAWLGAPGGEAPSPPRRAWDLPWRPPPGYHRVELRAESPLLCADAALIVVPARCYLPPALAEGGRLWGVTLQLYGLRSERNWGLGDLGDLAAALEALAPLGVDIVGINPLHALYLAEPSRASPYSPSSRCFANALYLNVEAIEDFGQCEPVRRRVADDTFQQRLARLRASELVDYEGVAAVKLPVLKELYDHFRARHLAVDSERGRAFRDYQRAAGPDLSAYADFEAAAQRRGGVGAEPEFYAYLQWQLDVQLDAAAARARALGMAVGLYRDLAVGGDAGGADVAADPALHAAGAGIGAPADDFSPSGQAWGLAPWIPQALRRRAYAPFVRCLRANMRAAGALRIDHVVGLMRLFWVPRGAEPGQGAYVSYPFADLLGIVALESQRNRCAVVGEDLGTVPDECRAALHEAGVLSYRVLYFEKHWHGDHSLRQPQEYPAQALATVSTHDLPTFAGFWSGRDLEVRTELGQLGDDGERTALLQAREEDRVRLLDALRHQGLEPRATSRRGGGTPHEQLVSAVHRYLARSAAAIMTIQMEDVLRETEQANLPGTTAEHPNWRRKLALPLEHWRRHAPLRALAEAIGRERARG